MKSFCDLIWKEEKLDCFICYDVISVWKLALTVSLGGRDSQDTYYALAGMQDVRRAYCLENSGDILSFHKFIACFVKFRSYLQNCK